MSAQLAQKSTELEDGQSELFAVHSSRFAMAFDGPAAVPGTLPAKAFRVIGDGEATASIRHLGAKSVKLSPDPDLRVELGSRGDRPARVPQPTAEVVVEVRQGFTEADDGRIVINAFFRRIASAWRYSASDLSGLALSHSRIPRVW